MRHRGRRAQALLEFAFLAPIFFLIITVVFDFARAAWTYSSLSLVAREGGRQAILAQYGTSNPTDLNITDAIQDYAFGLSLSTAGCVHGWSTAPTIHTPTTPNTGYIYILAGSSTPGAPNAPSGQTSGSAGAGCVSHIPAGYGANPLKVEIVYNFQPITPFASQFMPSGIPMTVTSTMYTEF